jgi:membrane-associated phospholipid phosphatase
VNVERRCNVGELLLLVRAPRHWMLIGSLGVVLAVLLGYVFGELAGDVWTGEGLAFDLPVMKALHHLASPWLTAALRLITDSASGLRAVGVAVGLAIWWWQRAGQRPEAVTLIVTLAGSAALGQGFKLLFARPRPRLFPWLTVAGGWSFPSGHTLTAVVLGGLLVWLVGRRLNGLRRVVLGTVAGLWTGLVGLSRIYLGVHYPSDVLASMALGGLCLLVALCVHWAVISQSVA